MDQRQPRLRLSKRDRRILRHVRDYGMTTSEVLHRTFFSGKGLDAMLSTLRRLKGDGRTYRFLRPQRLYGKRKYYRLTRRGAAIAGGSNRSQRFGVEARATRFAVLSFMHEERSGKRVLFNPRKLPDQFAIQGQRLPRKHFFIEETADGPRLGFIMVNLGGDTQRTVCKCLEIMTRFLNRHWFDEFFATRQFVLTILPVTEAKQEAIQSRLQAIAPTALADLVARFTGGARGKLPFEIRVVVIDELLNLVPGQRVLGKRQSKKSRRRS
jgi:hypothetical protein